MRPGRARTSISSGDLDDLDASDALEDVRNDVTLRRRGFGVLRAGADSQPSASAHGWFGRLQTWAGVRRSGSRGSARAGACPPTCVALLETGSTAARGSHWSDRGRYQLRS